MEKMRNRGFAAFTSIPLGILVGFFSMSCVLPAEKSASAARDSGRYDGSGVGGMAGFKVPVPSGFDWEVTQSWAEHCELCNARGYDWNYCAGSMSHTWDCCRYGWDFNLPGFDDYGKPVLASGNGSIRDTNDNTGWGVTLVVEHDGGVCSRYAHMKDGSTDHLEVGQPVCQGLKLGEIGDSGSADGSHLHFQFEDCESGDSLEMGFTDGNDVPVCTRGEDVYDSYGRYSFLRLSNELREDCSGFGQPFGGGELDSGGWRSASCGSLSGCPLIPNCGRGFSYQFGDYYHLGDRTAEAAAYLYGECALSGRSDGKLHPFDWITRAEALKIPMYLFGLMEDCGYSADFADVDEEDWFFNVVACAVRHGIVSNVATAFRPNDQVTFGEAAKMLVKSADRAGVIRITEPASGHFEDIDPSHWAYRYVETLYSYGGVVHQLLDHRASDKVERREYVIMAASLSPCFCANVQCGGGCSCDQENMACSDGGASGPGIGGGSSNDSEAGGGSSGGADSGDDAGEPDGSEAMSRGGDESSDDEGESGGGDDTAADRRHRADDLTIGCFVDVERSRCGDAMTVLYIKCNLENRGDEDVLVNNIVMSLTGASDLAVCSVTDEHLRQGVGVKRVSSGESERLSGHFEVSCSALPADGELEASFDLVERISGEVTLYEDFLEDQINVSEEPFASCSAGAGDDAGGGGDGAGGAAGDAGGAAGGGLADCNPDIGYTLWMWSPDGSFEIAATGLATPVISSFLPGMDMFVRFDCPELPAAVLVHGGLSGVHIWVGEGVPSFALYVPFDGPLTISPPASPDVVTGDFATDLANLDLLVRIPPE